MKKLSILLFAFVAAITLSACTDTAEVEGYYVAVDINPSIEFIVDGDDIVESFIFLNEDAAILCADLDFTGMNIDDAIELFVQTATEAGYIDPEGEDNAVLITVLGEDGEEARMEQIRERIRERLNRHFARRFINALVLTEDFTQEDLLAQAEELGVTAGKLKLALAAQLSDETLVLEELLELPVRDILAIVREHHQEDFEAFRAEHMEEFRARKEARLEEYQERLQNYIENHPELSEEEIEEIIQQARRRFHNETRQHWEQRQEEWRQNQEENDPECTEECNEV